MEIKCLNCSYPNNPFLNKCNFCGFELFLSAKADEKIQMLESKIQAIEDIIVID